MPLLPHTLSDLPPEMSRREALDRYSQHTEVRVLCVDASVSVVWD